MTHQSPQQGSEKIPPFPKTFPNSSCLCCQEFEKWRVTARDIYDKRLKSTICDQSKLPVMNKRWWILEERKERIKEFLGVLEECKELDKQAKKVIKTWQKIAKASHEKGEQ